MAILTILAMDFKINLKKILKIEKEKVHRYVLLLVD
jgi:hypothetical protein